MIDCFTALQLAIFSTWFPFSPPQRPLAPMPRVKHYSIEDIIKQLESLKTPDELFREIHDKQLKQSRELLQIIQARIIAIENISQATEADRKNLKVYRDLEEMYQLYIAELGAKPLSPRIPGQKP